MVKVNREPILVVQHRQNPAREQGVMEKLAAQAGMELRFANSLTDTNRQWRRNTQGPFSRAILLGSSDIDHTIPTPLLAQHDKRALPFYRELANEDKPFLAICVSHQGMARALGGEVVRDEKQEGDTVRLNWTPAGRESYISEDVDDPLAIIAVHKDRVKRRPKGSTVLATTNKDRNSMLQIGENGISMQPHPELDDVYMKEAIGSINQNLKDTPLGTYPVGEFRPTGNGEIIVVNFMVGPRTQGDFSTAA